MCSFLLLTFYNDEYDPTLTVFRNLFSISYFQSHQEQPTQQRFNLQPLNNASAFDFVRTATSNSVSPAKDLIDGAVYSVTLSYQDGGGNPPAIQLHEVSGGEG